MLVFWLRVHLLVSCLIYPAVRPLQSAARRPFSDACTGSDARTRRTHTRRMCRSGCRGGGKDSQPPEAASIRFERWAADDPVAVLPSSASPSSGCCLASAVRLQSACTVGAVCTPLRPRAPPWPGVWRGHGVGPGKRRRWWRGSEERERAGADAGAAAQGVAAARQQAAAKTAGGGGPGAGTCMLGTPACDVRGRSPPQAFRRNSHPWKVASSPPHSPRSLDPVLSTPSPIRAQTLSLRPACLEKLPLMVPRTGIAANPPT